MILSFLSIPNIIHFDRKIHTWKFKRAIKDSDLVIAISEQTKRILWSILKLLNPK